MRTTLPRAGPAGRWTRTRIDWPAAWRASRPPRSGRLRLRRPAPRARVLSAGLARRIVARVERRLQIFLGVVLPELADVRIREEHGVLELAADSLHLADVHVLDGIAERIDLHGAAREVLQLDLAERGQQRLAILHLAGDRLDGLGDPACVGVAPLRIVRGDLACLGLERLREARIGGVLERGRIVERTGRAEGLVAHLPPHGPGDGRAARP